MLDVVVRNRTHVRRYGPAFFERILRVAAAVAKLPAVPVEIGVVLIGEQKMRALNRIHRGADAVTDVLSFPLGGTVAKGYTEGVLGDILICTPYAARMARKERMPLRAKMAWLAVHGFLHILGYDHDRSASKARQMFSLEKAIFRRLKTSGE